MFPTTYLYQVVLGYRRTLLCPGNCTTLGLSSDKGLIPDNEARHTPMLGPDSRRSFALSERRSEACSAK